MARRILRDGVHAEPTKFKQSKFTPEPMSSNDQLNELLALERLQAQRRDAVIERRGKVILFVLYAILLAYVLLGVLDISDFSLETSTPDQSWIDRMCLFASWWVPAGMLVWSMASFRVIQSRLFLNSNPLPWMPWAAALTGSAVLAFALREWLHKPFSAETLQSFDAWKFGVAWALLGWAYVFRR